MALTPTTVTVRGNAARAVIDPRLLALVVALEAAPRVGGVVGYALGEGPRDEAKQLEYLNMTPRRTDAAWLESPHNWLDEHGRSQAVDVYPLRRSGTALVVSNDPADYRPIVDLAHAYGLVSGSTWEDWPHVEVPDWRGRRPSDWRQRAAPAAAASSGLLILLAVLAWRLLS